MIEIRCDERWEALINKSELQKILTVFLKHLFKEKCGISIFLANDDVIQKLNKTFRGKDYPTDILSWAYNDDQGVFESKMIDDEIGHLENINFAGELVLSEERVRLQASENGWDFETELIRLLAHGCAHLAGWDHERSLEESREMLVLEIELLNEVGLTNIY